DGKVIFCGLSDKTPIGETQMVKVSIFMSIFNVHVNRIPYDGLVTDILYSPGRFFPANTREASEVNESNAIILTTDDQQKVCFVQVAGIIARRIVCKISKGNRVNRGDRFGMICFGSRLDVYLPVETRVTVSTGDRVKAGTSILGYLQ
nr:phosphatidylserine decarboxylase family protein [Desulfobacterales bacterium]